MALVIFSKRKAQLNNSKFCLQTTTVTFLIKNVVVLTREETKSAERYTKGVDVTRQQMNVSVEVAIMLHQALCVP